MIDTGKVQDESELSYMQKARDDGVISKGHKR